MKFKPIKFNKVFNIWYLIWLERLYEKVIFYCVLLAINQAVLSLTQGVGDDLDVPKVTTQASLVAMNLVKVNI